jgi:hypothetical protein
MYRVDLGEEKKIPQKDILKKDLGTQHETGSKSLL